MSIVGRLWINRCNQIKQNYSGGNANHFLDERLNVVLIGVVASMWIMSALASLFRSLYPHRHDSIDVTEVSLSFF